MRACRPKRHEEGGEREREREKDTEPACAQERARPPAPLAPLFICFFLPLGLPYVNYTSQECCLYVLPEVLTPVLHLSLFYFCGLFPSLSFSHSHSGLLFPILTTKHFQWILRTNFLYDALAQSHCSARDSQESSPTPQFKSINSSVLSFLYSPPLTFIHDHWKNHSFD